MASLTITASIPFLATFISLFTLYCLYESVSILFLLVQIKAVFCLIRGFSLGHFQIFKMALAITNIQVNATIKQYLPTSETIFSTYKGSEKKY